MCTFCTFTKGEECKRIDTLSLDFGNVKDFLQVQLWLEYTEDDGFVLTTELVTEFGNGVDEMKTPIAYCPKCGKKLDENTLYEEESP